MDKTLGIIGGVGPMATVYFMEMLLDMTKAEKDQDHINMIVFNHSTIPDRTDYILKNSDSDPLPYMVEDAKMLQRAGAGLVVIPCNTAQYFFEGIQSSVGVPMLNIVEETVDHAVKTVPHLKKLGILATKGTVSSGIYQSACEKRGIECVLPDAASQESVMDIIYKQVKAGKEADAALLLRIIDAMEKKGAEAVVLGCTELSLVRKEHRLYRPDIIDSLEVLAMRTILSCGKELNDKYMERLNSVSFALK